MKRPRRIPDEALRKLYKAGVTQEEIARHYGHRHTETVRVHERSLGLPPRRPGGGVRLNAPSIEETLNG